ncbi:hypothetical protein BBAD15_g6028 [Beauveria bassiana D1-5]|uniref:Uncharacterized protein n=1 Tax=Beauveria bassiana D1-5 TaxID=1245745 RepID=A0A0A2VR59_BEABA|nr:hypothetical protein BBAD15_g6028 [Beauveria bassiana D1-5]
MTTAAQSKTHIVLQLAAYSGRSVVLQDSTHQVRPLCVASVALCRSLSPRPSTPSNAPVSQQKETCAQPNSQISCILLFPLFFSSTIPYSLKILPFLNHSVLLDSPRCPPRTPELPSGAPTTVRPRPVTPYLSRHHAPRLSRLHAIFSTHRHIAQPHSHCHSDYNLFLKGTALFSAALKNHGLSAARTAARPEGDPPVCRCRVEPTAARSSPPGERARPVTDIMGALFPSDRHHHCLLPERI